MSNRRGEASERLPRRHRRQLPVQPRHDIAGRALHTELVPAYACWGSLSPEPNYTHCRGYAYAELFDIRASRLTLSFYHSSAPPPHLAPLTPPSFVPYDSSPSTRRPPWPRSTHPATAQTSRGATRTSSMLPLHPAPKQAHRRMLNGPSSLSLPRL